MRIFIFIFCIVCCNLVAAKTKSVGITQIVMHTSLNETHRGIIETLKEHYEEGEIRIISENANSSMATNIQIAKKLSSLRPDLIIAISTTSAQAALLEAKKNNIPLIFAAVSDPIGAKLVSNLESPDNNVTGVMDTQPIDKQIELIRQYLPEAKKIGFVYNPGEVNSITILDILRKKAIGFEIIESCASTSQEVLSAAQSIIHKVDLIYVPTDNVVVSALDSLLKFSFSQKVPVISCDPDLVAKGALFSAGASYYQIGQAAGQLAVKILEGTSPSALPIEASSNYNIFFNHQSAEKLGINSLNQDPKPTT